MKRLHDGRERSAMDPPIPAFEAFRDEIDAFNDRRERLIKASRDVTALSKKIIFHLHRFSFKHTWPTRGADGTLAQSPENAQLLSAAHEKLCEVLDLLRAVADAEELTSASRAPGATMQRYERFIGGSLEEMVRTLHIDYSRRSSLPRSSTSLSTTHCSRTRTYKVRSAMATAWCVGGDVTLTVAVRVHYAHAILAWSFRLDGRAHALRDQRSHQPRPARSH